MSQKETDNHPLKKFLVLLLTVFVATWLAWAFKWQVFDWWRLRSYTASPGVVRLTDRVQMTEKARNLFYVYHAELQDKQSFNSSCDSSEETIVLGCYVGGQGIYIYNVDDERLAGIEEVTAAHEVLHAAYDRLSDKQKDRIDHLVLQAFEELQSDRIRSTIENYRRKDPNIVPNELHSIIGTEVREISPELETYYAQYFRDRQAIVGFSEQYEAAFTSRQQQVEEIDKQLEKLRADIENQQSSLAELRLQIVREKQRLDSLLERQAYEQYNSGVDGFNRMVRNYNSNIQKLQNNIAEYNRLVQERNSIALEENELLKAIDSRPEALPTR